MRPYHRQVPSDYQLFSRSNNQGFTLVEMVVSIVLLGIIAVMTTQYYSHTVIGFADTQLRNDLANVGRLAIERVGRELRNAAPNTVRINNNCIEFLPVVGSGQYQDQNINYPGPIASTPLPVIGFNPAAINFDVLDLNLPGAGTSLIVYPLGPGTGSDDPYAGTNPGPLIGMAGSALVIAGVTNITMAGLHSFNRHSPQRRMFVVGDPVSFCVVGTDLNRYTGYVITAVQATPPAAVAQLLAQDIQLNEGGPITPFSYTAGTLVSNAVVQLDFRFMQTDHLGNQTWVRMNHEFQIRNVP